MSDDSAAAKSLTLQEASLVKLSFYFAQQEIGEVLARDPDYAAEYFDLQVGSAETATALVARVLNDAGKRIAGLPDHAQLAQLDQIISSQDPHEDYRTWFDLVRADIERSRAFDSYLSELLRAPTWDLETFAAVSLGKRPEEIPTAPSQSKGPAASSRTKLFQEYNRRLRFLNEASALEGGHPEALRRPTTPRDLIRWTLSGCRFEIPALLSDFAAAPDYARFIASRKAPLPATQPIGEKQARISSLQDEIRSLRRICILLLACIPHLPPRKTKLLFPPPRDSRSRSRFVGDMARVTSTILSEDDQPTNKTITKHLTEAFASLSETSQRSWTDYQRDQDLK